MESDNITKKAWGVTLNVIFWITVVVVFTNFSFMRPQFSTGNSNIIAPLLLAGMVYLNYFLIYPRLYENYRIKYWLITISLSLFLTIIELYIFRNDFLSIYHRMNPYFTSTFFHIFTRNMAFILCSLYFSHSKTLKIKQKKEILQLEKELSWEKEKYEIEREYMRYKIAPHFLHNIINYILFCSMERKDELPHLLYKLSGVLDYYMNDSSEPLVRFADDYAFYEKYIELENMRYENVIDVKITTDKSLNNTIIAPLLFECYIGNAFKYTPHDETGKIEIIFERVEQNKLMFICKNTKQKVTKRHGLVSSKNGLAFNKKRLDFLYNIAHQLVIEEFDDSYLVKLVLRIKTDIENELKIEN